MSGLIYSSVVTCISFRAFYNTCIDTVIYINGKASLRFETFTITHFALFLLLIQWQSSTLEGSTLTSKFSKIFKTVLSRVLLLFVSGMSANSRHSHLQYWLLLQHWRSKLVTLSLKTELTCLATERSEPSFSKPFFTSRNLFLVPANVEWNLLW